MTGVLEEILKQQLLQAYTKTVSPLRGLKGGQRSIYRPHQEKRECARRRKQNGFVA